MTRLRYWLTAQTIYSVHSPFVFTLCRDVLFTRASRQGERLGGSRRYNDLRYKLQDYLNLHIVSSSADETLMAGSDDVGKVLLICRPHRCRDAEAHWTRLCQSPDYRVSIDLYDVGILFSNAHLHPQHFLLR